MLPLVFHQGPKTWNVSTAFEDLFELPDEISKELLPFLPKFSHALVDLTRFDPTTRECDTRLRIVLQLMKLARQKELLRFFRWLADVSPPELPDNLLSLMLLYSLHADSDLDAEKIYHSLSTNPELKKSAMSVAEKLIAQGHAEGELKGKWIGKIQLLEEFMGSPVTSQATLTEFSPEELEARYQTLHLAYAARFKG